MGLAQPGAVVFQAPVLAGSGSRRGCVGTPRQRLAWRSLAIVGGSVGAMAVSPPRDDAALHVRRPMPELGRDMVADAGLCCGPRKTNGWVQ